MYSTIFRYLLVGPTWLRVIEALILVGLVVYGLLFFGYPWFHEVYGGTMTVEEVQSW